MVVNGRQPLWRRRASKAAWSIPGPTLHERRRARARSTATSSGATTTAARKPTCPGTQDYKQIVVAVKLDKPANQSGRTGLRRSPVGLRRSRRTAPEQRPGARAPNGVVTAQQFFLSDTPCAAAARPPRRPNRRRPSAAQHARHLRQRPQNGTTPGAPDALLLGGPPDPAPEDATQPAALRLLQRLLSRADARHRQGRADPPRRHQRLPLHADRDAQLRSRRCTAGSPTRWPPNSR